MKTYRVTYHVVTTERRECLVEADGREDAFDRFERGEGTEDVHLWEVADLKNADVYFHPPQECARPGCTVHVGPSEGTPTPDEYCSLSCAIEDGAVSEKRAAR